jgi:DNA polymerase elongation subunit (family B)
MLIHTGAASRIESLILREYVRQKHSVPKPMEGSRNINIPAEIYHIGVFSDVLYIELEGIYPSIILRQNIKPRTDDLDVFLSLLTSLTSLQQNTLGHKHAIQSQGTNPDARLNSLKRLLDSFHLSLGSAKGLYNDPDQAEIVVTASREILKEIIHQIELFNATIIQTDGQGFFLLLPDNIIGEENRNNFIDRLSNTLPSGITLMLLHHYKKMLSYRKSNYAVLDQNNNVLIKGNSLISRGMERYLRMFIQRFIESMLMNDLTRLHHTYATAYTQIVKHNWTPLDFCKTEFVRMDTETYQKEIAAGRITPSPALEAAVRSISPELRQMSMLLVLHVWLKIGTLWEPTKTSLTT